ncbi:hypothetical protein [Novosphingobium rosa]|uniref:hypothetical protein n=1 Tax=Novosphingobium rosa TaxID=76978 RepID=UPI0012EE6295|nr:hypothetical protein [Novosphingobium rosa]
MLACLVLRRGFALLEAVLARTGTLWRLILFMIAALLLIMTGSTAHDDYMIWWMPAALAAFARKSEEQLAETPMATMPLAAAG